MLSGVEAEMEGIHIMDNPGNTIRDALDLVAIIASGISSEPLQMPEGGPKRFKFTSCDYCGSRYTFGLRENCPRIKRFFS